MKTSEIKSGSAAKSVLVKRVNLDKIKGRKTIESNWKELNQWRLHGEGGGIKGTLGNVQNSLSVQLLNKVKVV